MDAQISAAAKQIVDSLTKKGLRTFHENAESVKFADDVDSVTIILPSKKRIRILVNGKTTRPDYKKAGKLEGAEASFLDALRRNPTLAEQVRIGFTQTKRQTAHTALEYAEAL